MIIQDSTGSVSVAFWGADAYFDSFEIGDSILIESPRVSPKSQEYQRGGTSTVELVRI
jgi:ssDNA-binding replication factor A large subunit